MAEVNWTTRARLDADEICAYIEQSSESNARLIARELLETAERIRANPALGSIVPEYGRADVREMLCHSYRVIYLIRTEEVVDIIAVRRGARRLPRRLPH